MGILVDEETRVIVQGMTGRQGSFHTRQMMEYGTRIVAGVTPGKGGETIHGVPVFDTVEEALRREEAEAAVLFVPARHAPEAALEALENGLLTVIITEGVPVHDTLRVLARARERRLTVIGPNCPGITAVGACKIGIMPNHLFREGPLGIVSRSGTLTYEILYQLTRAGIGQSTAIGIGGDRVIGFDFVQALEIFREDEETEQVVLIGEIGGNLEEKAAEYLSRGYPKEVVGYIAGRTAPPEKRMGHAGAIITEGAGTAESKIRALERAGVRVAEIPSQIPLLLRRESL
jgi:succinyl-CoA synthetase alpha subunit